jgi:hypothetical protein
VLSQDEIEAALNSGYELRGFELKGPGSRGDIHLFAKVTRAALGIGNLRDGGHVIIGIDDGDPAAMRPGLQGDDLRSWLAFDDIARKLAEYADPPLRFDVVGIDLTSGVTIAVIQVFEFSDIPHLCGKDFPGVLRKGALYVRPRKVPETSEVASSIEMRELLDLATEKALRAYVETGERAGVTLSTTIRAPEAPSDDERYEDERREAWS